MKQPDYGCFVEYFDEDGLSLYFSIHPEMHPTRNDIAPTGRYFVYCIHPVSGSGHFIVEQDAHFAWFSKDHPPFIHQHFITWIGERIELRRKADF